jgi:KDO2-lipid IV(A) lauroyltransferase
VIVGIHLSNYDLAFLALQAVYLRSKKALILTLSELKGGYQWQYEMRQNKGMEIVPTTPSALRQAVERLRSGGIVLTGLDRPIRIAKYRPRFFGRPASLPVHHIYLALKGHAPVYLTGITMQADGTYHLFISEPIAMRSHPDRQKEILMNAETVLQVAENFIRPVPQQWAMTFPVWPDALNQVP